MNVNDVLREVIREQLNLPANSVRPANQNAPTNDSPYITVLVTALNSTGWDDNKLKPGSVNQVIETVQGTSLCRVSIQAFKSNAVFLLSLLKAKLQHSSAVEKLRLHNITVSRFLAVTDLSAINGTFWEERSRLEIEVYVVVKSEAVLDTFGTFPITVSTENLTSTSEVIEP
jgi:hypothetical protein